MHIQAEKHATICRSVSNAFTVIWKTAHIIRRNIWPLIFPARFSNLPINRSKIDLTTSLHPGEEYLPKITNIYRRIPGPHNKWSHIRRFTERYHHWRWSSSPNTWTCIISYLFVNRNSWIYNFFLYWNSIDLAIFFSCQKRFYLQNTKTLRNDLTNIFSII